MKVSTKIYHILQSKLEKHTRHNQYVEGYKTALRDAMITEVSIKKGLIDYMNGAIVESK